MHYKNGRLAKEGDSVIGLAHIGCGMRVVAGTVHQLHPTADRCNGVLVVPVVGGNTSTSVTLGELLHAEDALRTAEADIAAKAPHPTLPPHQHRVVLEKAELDDKRNKLRAFIDSNPIFAGLPEAEQVRLVRQINCMTEYSNILDERIAAFPSA